MHYYSPALRIVFLIELPPPVRVRSHITSTWCCRAMVRGNRVGCYTDTDSCLFYLFYRVLDSALPTLVSLNCRYSSTALDRQILLTCRQARASLLALDYYFDECTIIIIINGTTFLRLSRS